MSNGRVAVDVGAHSTRVATGSGVTVHTPTAPGDPAAALKAALAGARPAQLVLTHPAGWSPRRIDRLRQAGARLAGQVELLAAPLAAAGSRTGTVAVLDVGARSAEATVIAVSVPSRAPSERESTETVILACQSEAVGGDDLDEALLELVGRLLPPSGRARLRELLDSIDPSLTSLRRDLRAAARRARERLSTAEQATLRLDDPAAEVVLSRAQLTAALAPVLGRAVDLLAATVADAGDGSAPWPPVLLIGGLSQTPLLAELVADRAGQVVTVAADPATAAVRGALAAATPPPAEAAARPLLPALPRPRRHPVRNGLLAALAAVLLAVVGHLLIPPAPQPPPPTDGLLVQYDYALQLPAGWRHTGGLPEQRRSLLTPADRPGGSDVISVEQTVLDYDTAAEPRRAAAELRARYDAAVSAGAALDGFDAQAGFAGRPVTAYLQRQPERDAVVDWYVIFEGAAQLSVGCQHTAAGAAAVRLGCETVVASLHLRPH